VLSIRAATAATVGERAHSGDSSDEAEGENGAVLEKVLGHDDSPLAG
jgi:hypothetical protein